MPKRSLLLPACFVMIALSDAVIAQRVSEKIDKYIAKTLIERHITGLSLAVIYNGVPVKVKGYGYSDIENKVPVKPGTIFQSGSIGKQFTATAILQLKEEGKLKLDDKISGYFKQLPDSWKDITIRNLLTHTSGIPDYETANLIDLRKDYTEQELFELATKLPLQFKAGEKWSYSNTGYVLLGILIHQLTGRFYGDVLQSKIFGPLAMKTTRIISEQDIVMNRSSGYELQNGAWINQNWVAPSINTTADGALYLSVQDLIKWDEALSKEKILNHQDLEAMMTPVHLNNDSLYPYGFAWFLDPVNGHRAARHSGSWQGYNNYIARFPDDKLTVIVLTNTYPSNPGLIATDIASFYAPELSRPTYTYIWEKDTSTLDLITKLLQNKGNADLNNQLISADAIPEIEAFLSNNHSMQAVYGAIEEIRAVKESARYRKRYLIKYKVGSMLVSITTNQLNQITGITGEEY